MAIENWNHARLIPTSGISGSEEQERRATSALLAVMGVVTDFGRTVLAPLGAPSGAVDTYIEVPFDHAGHRYYPDGLVRARRGKRVWTALVEVKTGRNTLSVEQLETYLDIAKIHEFDAVITISNEVPPIFGQHPTKVDRRKLRKVDLHHWSWTYLLTTAVIQREHRGVSDPEQAWILGELIRYLEHPKSGALEFDDMGPGWVPTRDGVAAGTLRASDQFAGEVVLRFEGLVRYLALLLGRQLGTDVTPVRSRKELSDPVAREQALLTSLVSDGVLTASLRIPDAVGPIVLTADLRAARITCHCDIDAPRQGRPTTRINWMSRQLKSAPDGVRVEATFVNQRGPGTADVLSRVREDPGCLIGDPKKEIRSFRLALSAPMGVKRGTGRGTFIDSVVALVDRFYGEVLQDLKVWAAAPPRLRQEAPVSPPSNLASTSLSSQDGPMDPAATDTGA